jgi:hypothetical protein
VLGDPERDVGLVRSGDRPVSGPVRLDHPQSAVADVGDASAGRIRARIGHRALDGQAAGLGIGYVHCPQPAVQGEGRQPGGLVSGIRTDSHAQFGRPSGKQFGGIGEQPLRPRIQVQRPQAAHRVIARPAAQEQHHRPVPRDRELIGNAQAEAARPGDLARQGDRRHVRPTVARTAFRSGRWRSGRAGAREQRDRDLARPRLADDLHVEGHAAADAPAAEREALGEDRPGSLAADRG